MDLQSIVSRTNEIRANAVISNPVPTHKSRRTEAAAEEYFTYCIETLQTVEGQLKSVTSPKVIEKLVLLAKTAFEALHSFRFSITLKPIGLYVRLLKCLLNVAEDQVLSARTKDVFDFFLDHFLQSMQKSLENMDLNDIAPYYRIFIPYYTKLLSFTLQEMMHAFNKGKCLSSDMTRSFSHELLVLRYLFERNVDFGDGYIVRPLSILLKFVNQATTSTSPTKVFEIAKCTTFLEFFPLACLETIEIINQSNYLAKQLGSSTLKSFNRLLSLVGDISDRFQEHIVNTFSRCDLIIKRITLSSCVILSRLTVDSKQLLNHHISSLKGVGQHMFELSLYFPVPSRDFFIEREIEFSGSEAVCIAAICRNLLQQVSEKLNHPDIRTEALILFRVLFDASLQHAKSEDASVLTAIVRSITGAISSCSTLAVSIFREEEHEDTFMLLEQMLDALPGVADARALLKLGQVLTHLKLNDSLATFRIGVHAFSLLQACHETLEGENRKIPLAKAIHQLAEAASSLGDVRSAVRFHAEGLKICSVRGNRTGLKHHSGCIRDLFISDNAKWDWSSAVAEANFAAFALSDVPEKDAIKVLKLLKGADVSNKSLILAKLAGKSKRKICVKGALAQTLYQYYSRGLVDGEVLAAVVTSLERVKNLTPITMELFFVTIAQLFSMFEVERALSVIGTLRSIKEIDPACMTACGITDVHEFLLFLEQFSFLPFVLLAVRSEHITEEAMVAFHTSGSFTSVGESFSPEQPQKLFASLYGHISCGVQLILDCETNAAFSHFRNALKFIIMDDLLHIPGYAAVMGVVKPMLFALLTTASLLSGVDDEARYYATSLAEITDASPLVSILSSLSQCGVELAQCYPDYEGVSSSIETVAAEMETYEESDVVNRINGIVAMLNGSTECTLPGAIGGVCSENVEAIPPIMINRLLPMTDPSALVLDYVLGLSRIIRTNWRTDKIAPDFPSQDDFTALAMQLSEDTRLFEMEVVEKTLYISVIEQKQTISAAIPVSDDFKKFMTSFYNTVEESVRGAKLDTEDKVEWWRKRNAVDDVLDTLSQKIDSELYMIHGLLNGKRADLEQRATVTQIAADLSDEYGLTGAQRFAMELVVDLSPAVPLFLVEALGLEPDEVDLLLECVNDLLADEDIVETQRCHAQLALGRQLIWFPIERILTNTRSVITRVTDLHLLVTLEHLQKSRTVGRHSYFMVNPSGDLPGCEKTFATLLKGTPGFRGTVGAIPRLYSKKNNSTQRNENKNDLVTLHHMFDEITSSDIFLYFGHGAGQQHLDFQRVVRENAAPSVCMLFGCSSGAQVFTGPRGVFLPWGKVSDLLVSGTLFAVGCLWDVTEDIDRLANPFLKHYFGNETRNNNVVVGEALEQGISSVKAKALTGLSVVMYGLPTLTEHIPNYGTSTTQRLVKSVAALNIGVTPRMPGKDENEGREALQNIRARRNKLFTTKKKTVGNRTPKKRLLFR
ncbi:hypothetical protein PCE1_004455 [Barthelona sp. PCE]